MNFATMKPYLGGLLAIGLLMGGAPSASATPVAPLSDSFIVHDGTGAVAARVDAFETTNEALTVFTIPDPNLADPSQFGFATQVLDGNGQVSDYFGVTKYKNADGVDILDANGNIQYVLAFLSDGETGLVNVVDFSNAVSEGSCDVLLDGLCGFDASQYLNPGLKEGGYTAMFYSDVSDVPEPATLGIFGVGLAGLGWMRRRRKSA
jgi:hypothetical protein